MWPEPATSNPNQVVGAGIGQQTQTDIQFKLYTGRGHTILNILNNFKQFVTIFVLFTDD